MKKILALFADTNLFIQCKPLHELSWEKWSEYDEIELIIARPVQFEIDNLKSKGSGRVQKKARAASSTIKEILRSDKKLIEIRARAPKVVMLLRQDLKQNPDIQHLLDYSERDDQLVGVISSFIQKNPELPVYLFTHDTGPMASAELVNIPYIDIPDDWLLSPESDEGEKLSVNYS